MKIEQLIVQHLYNSKIVSLQDIGTFYLSPSISMPVENDKEVAMPENAVRFEFNKRAPKDDDLIAFIVAQTRKIKPLATSDLESYSILARQFLNIGKPFPIEGLGVLQINQAGDYEFLQGNYINARLDAAPALLKEKTKEEISFSTPAKAVSNNKKWMMLTILGFVLLTVATLYYFLRSDDNSVLPYQPLRDSSHVIQDSSPVKKDTIPGNLSQPADTLKHETALVVPTDFKIIVREYDTRAKAEKAVRIFGRRGQEVQIFSQDSVLFKVGVPFTASLSDTSRIVDSMRVVFKGQPYADLN